MDAMPRTSAHLGTDALQVIDCLEVGPVRIHPRRLSCPYAVTAGGHTATFDFACKYDEDVFGPAADDSLADMVAAQLAINYGLFCKRLVFQGRYDRFDQRFILAMAENTAREIFVNKLLKPNPFIEGLASLAPVRSERYLEAEIEFPNSDPTATARPGPVRDTRDRCCVLSSGGKESLLSYALLNEIGCEVHPVFINESGRHWFTALNAYRRLATSDPHTARVWTNADRGFNWMLKHLPFVRKDFADVRADVYPIRLWTVAVFVFAALPLLRQRGIGRLIIGDEYDTTVKKTLRGIPHFGGLYDQSRYFDDALSRYFAAKRWGISQFSIVRPLSELLVERVLSERYPDLLQLQVSCHAARVAGERVLPCGRCEKCRRIVGMLQALEVDPAVCGYTPDDITRCIRALADRGTHQGVADAQHLGHLLQARGLLPGAQIGRLTAQARPEVMKLRFDAQRSPINGIPARLRRPLWSLLLQHTDGAVHKHGRMWADIDPLSEEWISRPYPLERPAMSQRDQPSGNGFLLEALTWPEAQQRFRDVDLALLPVGAIEQHGPHLPLDVDTHDAEYLARKVAEACTDPKPIVLPAIPYGVSYHHEDFSGTISVSNETLAKFVYEVGMGCARNGITKLVIINGHGGNSPTLHFAAQMINRDAHIFTCVDTGETSDADVEAMIDTPNDAHAGEIETSTTLAVRPEVVKPNKAKKSVPQFSSRYLDFSSKRSVGWYGRTAKISPTGVMGDPTKATAEKGARMWEVIIRNLTEFIEQLKSMSLDEIYQRDRY